MNSEIMVNGNLTLQIAISSQHTKGKIPQNSPDWAAFNDSFIILEVTVDELIGHIQQGHSYTSPHQHLRHLTRSGKQTAYRHQKNWQSSQHLALDFDDGKYTLEQLANLPFIRDYAAFLHTTRSHTPEHPRARAVFITDVPFTSKHFYSQASEALTHKFTGQADRACKDVARFFYGATDCHILKLDHLLSMRIVDEVVSEYQLNQRSLATPNENATTKLSADVEEVREALNYITYRPDYEEWRNIVWAVNSAVGSDQALILLQGWRPEEQPGEYERLLKYDSGHSNGRGIGSGTLFHLARQNGYTSPAHRHETTNTTNNSNGEVKNTPLLPNINEQNSGVDNQYLVRLASEKATNLTDLGNARRLIKHHGNQLMYVKRWESWYIWDNSRWVKDETGEIERRAKATVATIYIEASQVIDESQRKAIVKWGLASENYQRLMAMIKVSNSEPGISVPYDQLDSHLMLLNCRNGTLDLTTGELLPHNRTHYHTKCLAVDYCPDAQCPKWLTFLERIMGGNLELVDFLQRAVGYTLTGKVSDQCMFFMYGKGKNGKSTFVETLLQLLGEYAQKAPTEMLMAKYGGSGIPNDLARLPGARLVAAAEVEQGRRLAESIVKDLTGGDTIIARFLRQEFFEFKPTHKLWMYGNHKPVISGTDEGIWRRIHLIPFSIQIPEEEQDPHLLEKLLAELPGILAWAMKGCRIWEQYGLRVPEAVKVATAAYRSEMDTIGAFVEDCCLVDQMYHTKMSEVYEAYQIWGEENGERVLGKRKFGDALTEKGFKAGKGNRNVSIRWGLALKTELDLESDAP